MLHMHSELTFEKKKRSAHLLLQSTKCYMKIHVCDVSTMLFVRDLHLC